MTGPLSATLFERMESSTSFGSGSPNRARASEPTTSFSHSTSTPAHSMIETTEAVTSGPIPSPGRRVILCLAMSEHPFHTCTRLGEGELHRQQLGEGGVIGQLAQAAQHALDRRRDELEVVQLA